MNTPMQEAIDFHEAAKQVDLAEKKLIENGAEWVIITWFPPDWFEDMDWSDAIEISIKDIE